VLVYKKNFLISVFEVADTTKISHQNSEFISGLLFVNTFISNYILFANIHLKQLPCTMYVFTQS